MSEGVAQLKHEVTRRSPQPRDGGGTRADFSFPQGSQRQVVVAGAVAGLVSRYIFLQITSHV